MLQTTNTKEIVAHMIAAYGIEGNGVAPTAEEWEAVVSQPVDQPITLINFFKFKEIADYGPSNTNDARISGQEAFGKYAAISMPGLAKAGGNFLVTAPFGGIMINDGKDDKDWDMIVVGHYPNRASFLALYADPDYIQAFSHRCAALARQKVLFCTG